MLVALQYDKALLEQKALAAIDGARNLAEKYFRRFFHQELKADQSPVTEVDLAIETYLRTELAKSFPEFGFWGEEGGKSITEGGTYWLIDPIDGTRSFLSGNPVFACLLSLLVDNKPVFGVIDMPILKERWKAWQPTKTSTDKIIATTRTTTELRKALVAATTPFMFNAQPAHFLEALNTQIYSWRWGGDAYNYGLLADGHLDIVVEADMKFYDCGALIPVVTAAGGCISDWHGNPIQIGFDGTVLASANLTLHKQMLDWLSSFYA